MVSVASQIRGQTSLGVEHVGPREISGEAGSRVIVGFRLINRGPVARRVTTSVGLPNGWQLVIPDSAAALAAGATDLRLMPIAIPTSVRAGTYAVRYEGFFDGEPASRTADSVIVDIAQRRQLAATVAEAPSFAGAGDSYRAAFVIRNIGNVVTDVRVTLIGDRDVDATLDSSAFRIEPGDERRSTATIQTSLKSPRKVIQRVGIVAAPTGDTTGQASVSSGVEIIPRQPREVSARLGLPLLLGIAKSDAGTIAPELSGGGYLTRARTVRADFLARPRAPGDFMLSQDEYRLSISSDRRYRLRLGDQLYNGARLTQSVRPGAGASAELWLGPLILEGLALTDRRTPNLTKERQYGGMVDLRLFTDRARIGGGFLSRTGVDSGTILLGRGLALLPGQNLFRWEYGVGQGGRGTAYIVSMEGGGGILSYGVQRATADTAFPGIGAGDTYTALNARLRATKHVALLAGAAERTHATNGVFLSRPSLYRELESGVNITQLLGITYRLTRDTGRIASLARTSQSGRVALRFPVVAHVGLGANLEHGFSNFDNAPDVRVPFNRIGGRAEIAAGAQRLVLSIDRITGTPAFGQFEVDQTIARVYTDIRLGGATNLNIGFNASRSGPDGWASSVIDIGVNQRLARGHQVRWIGQSFATGLGNSGRQSRQRAQYTIPLSAPLPGEDETGSVEVRLVDGSARGIANVLVRLGGDARLTDAMGRARFGALMPGTYQMDVDRARIGAGRIVSPALPLTLDVNRGERRTLELRFTSAAQVIGVVRRMDFQENRPLGAPDSLIEAGGQSGIRLQLTNNGDTLRTVSNGGGRFRFGDVRAGRWVLTMLPIGIPPQHRGDPGHIELDVSVGETEDVSLTLLPMKPNVVFIADEDLSAERPTVTAAVPVAPRTPAFHVVASNDTSLLQVARKVYGDATLWPKIWVANRGRLPRPELMHVGDTLVVPAQAPLTRAEIAARDAYRAQQGLPRGWPRADASWVPPAVQHYFTVTRHDASLTAIARAMYGNSALWPKIWLANLDLLASPDDLRAGQRLRVPDAGPLTRAELAARDAYIARRRRD
jgi:hypothetical protein